MDMRTKYEFHSTLHRNSREMHQHVADAYMTAGWLNDEKDIARFFAEYTDTQLADDAIANWELGDNPDFDREELLESLKDMRRTLTAQEKRD
jgi:hypothetical protein